MPSPMKWLATALLCASGSIPSLADDKAPAEAGTTTFGDVVDVQLVNVEVWVSDGKGRPIVGLTAEDFTVREDGKPVEVTHFSEVRGGVERSGVPRSDGPRSGVPAPDAASSNAVPSGFEPTAVPEVATQPSDPGHLVLYFDQLHLSQSGRKQVIKDVKRFLDDGSVPAARVMILSQTEDLATLASFGSTRADLETALDGAAEAAGGGNATERDKLLAIRNLQTMWEIEKTKGGRTDPCFTFPPLAMNEIDQFAYVAGGRIATTLRHLADVTRFLSAVLGVKSLVYVGDQLTTTPGLGLVTFIDVVCPAGRREDQRLEVSGDMIAAFVQLTRHANTNQVTFYAFQAGGLQNSLLMSASMATSDLLAGGGRFDFALRTNERAGHTFLAVETGGLAMFNSNHFDAQLKTVAEEMSGYYSLAYPPPHGGDLREHEIDVEVLGKPPLTPGGQPVKKVEVRHRRGYRDKGADERMSERLLAAIQLGLVSNPLEARLGAGEIRELPGGSYVLPLHVFVPAERVVYLPQESGEVAILKVQVTAQDADSRQVISGQRTFRVEQPAEPQDNLLDLVIEFEVGGGQHTLAVGIRDEASRETSYVSTGIEIQPPATG